MADQNNNVGEEADYFKIIIYPNKSSIRKVNLKFSINDVVTEIDDTITITKITAEDGVEVDPTLTFAVLKSFGFVYCILE